MIGTLFAGFRRWMGLGLLGGVILAFGPQGALAAGFDFRLLDLEITGQHAFFDDFEDGNRLGGTARLIDRQGSITTESDGALNFTDADGTWLRTFSDGFQWYQDRVNYGRVFLDQGGSVDFIATLAPVTPTEDLQLFVITAFSGFQTYDFGISFGTIGGGAGGPCGTGLAAEVFDITAESLLGCDAISSSEATGNLILKVTWNDANNTIEYLYSADGGVSFTSMTDFDVPVDMSLGFPPSGFTYQFNLNAVGLLPEPHAALLLLLGAGIGIGTRRRRR